MKQAAPRAFTASELARAVGAELLGATGARIDALATIEEAGPSCLTFMRSRSTAVRWAHGAMGAALVGSASRRDALGDEGEAGVARWGATRALLIVPDADLALNVVLELFAPGAAARPPGVHPTSVVEHGASVHPSVHVGPHCVIERGASVGEGSVLRAGVFLGAGSMVGRGCLLHPHVTILERCEVGARCILHTGVVIGADGFGYRPAPDGRGVVKVPHIGIVRLGDDVEIGANTCIDRAKFGVTSIGNGTKIDNLVQIAHNCVIGRSCVICGKAALAGSVTLGDGVTLGGCANATDGVHIGDGAILGAWTSAASDIPAGQVYMGVPAMPAADWRRMIASQRRAARARRDGRGGG
jgi:UDP-3-O-[3-hydroxymyristoyl] glucosamine N-acyltransferase